MTKRNARLRGASGLFACAATALVMLSPASAADYWIDTIKDPLPEKLSWKGITVYGVIDVNYTWQSKGQPFDDDLYPGTIYGLLGAPGAHKAYWGFAQSGLSQSSVGVKIEEPLGEGWSVVGKFDTGFNPLSLELSDACASVSNNSGKSLRQQSANVDGSRCGQALNGSAFAGISNANYGTLTFGRQNAFNLDSVIAYDPMGASYAFSFIGMVGITAGMGSTEAARWDNSIRYTYNFGPFHAGAMYAFGAEDSAIHADAYGLNIGGKWQGLSVDAVFAQENSVVNAGRLATYQKNALAATITDNTSASIMGKYTFNLGGGLKDAPGDKLTVYGGYQYTVLSNPDDPLTGYHTTIGGYRLATINNQAYQTDRILNLVFAGAKYEMPSGWSFAAGWYHFSQDSWVARSLTNVDSAKCSTSVRANCSGDYDQVSFMVDYAINKHLDVYSGIGYTAGSDGLVSGYLADSDTYVVTGMRLKF
jgi:predicted porin